eukprot:Colp12_sorted_trinity150504_noHs@17469
MATCLALVFGLPGAGKTTFVSELTDTLRKGGTHVIVFTYDDIITDDVFKLPVTEARWKVRRNDIFEAAKLFLKAICSPGTRNITSTSQILKGLRPECVCSCLADDICEQKPNHVILFDDNFYYSSMRYDIYQIAAEYKVSFCQIFMEESLEICIARDRQRAQPVGVDIINGM